MNYNEFSGKKKYEISLFAYKELLAIPIDNKIDDF
jgi:hypothetical protein